MTAATTADVVAGTPDDWEVWEGCLIRTDALTVTGPPDAYGSAPLSNGASIDDMFVDFEVSEGESISSITGVVTYTHDAYRILPRTAEDITR